MGFLVLNYGALSFKRSLFFFNKIKLRQNPEKQNIIAFLIRTKKIEKPLYNFVVSVDKIEQKLGNDFFSKLENQMEIALEKGISYKRWNFD